jgi:hypothetical protein
MELFFCQTHCHAGKCPNYYFLPLSLKLKFSLIVYQGGVMFVMTGWRTCQIHLSIPLSILYLNGETVPVLLFMEIRGTRTATCRRPRRNSVGRRPRSQPTVRSCSRRVFHGFVGSEYDFACLYRIYGGLSELEASLVGEGKFLISTAGTVSIKDFPVAVRLQ